MGDPGLALPLFGQAGLTPYPPSARAAQNKGLVIGFQLRKATSFFGFSRQILQIFIGNCEPHRSKTGFVRHLFFPVSGRPPLEFCQFFPALIRNRDSTAKRG
jgi:hypothetical protein